MLHFLIVSDQELFHLIAPAGLFRALFKSFSDLVMLFSSVITAL